jgi:N12 class adenine-specific DNA methylase
LRTYESQGLAPYSIITGNSSPNARTFRNDPDLPLLRSLENFNEETRVAKKTAIFRERTIQRLKPAESAQTGKEALLISLNENGKIDLDHMNRLLKKPVEEFLPELKGAMFHDPQVNRWEPEDAYLSGNIREKLAIAENAARSDPKFVENVEALKAVVPEDLHATEIDARLGSVWIPEVDVERFVQDLLKLDGNGEVTIRHVTALGAWSFQADWQAKGAVPQSSQPFDDGLAATQYLLEDLFGMLARRQIQLFGRDGVQLGKVGMVVVGNLIRIEDMLAD